MAKVRIYTAGYSLWVEGDTYDIKETLKFYRFKWSPDNTAWHRTFEGFSILPELVQKLLENGYQVEVAENLQRLVDDPRCQSVPNERSSSKPRYSNSTVTVTTPGVYKLPNGEIYVVKPNRQKTRLYAKRLVEAPSSRLTEQGEVVDFDFEYAPGAIFHIRPEYQMDIEEAEKLMIRYGRCIVCGRRLKRAESVRRGIGPICIKYFRGGETRGN